MSQSGTAPAQAAFNRGCEMNRRILETVLPPATAEELVQVLNGSVLSASGKSRVKRIIQLSQKYQTALARFGLAWWRAARSQSELQHLLAVATAVPGDALNLDDLLSRYWVSPRIVLHNHVPRMVYVVKSKGNRRAAEFESGAVMCVLQLALRDELDRVRVCNCGKFFFAHRIDQCYCGTNCRVRYHQSSEEFRARRRVYLRNLYRLKKSGKVK